MTLKRRATWQEAYDAQMGLWRWERSADGRLFQAAHFESNGADLHESTQKMLAALYRAEEDKLLTADPIFVSTEMCEVIEAARWGFEPEPLYPTDFITSHGFLYFERPFHVHNRFDEPTNIAAASWSPTVAIKEGLELTDDVGKEINEFVKDMQGVPIDKSLLGEEAKQWEDNAREGSIAMDGIALTIYTSRPADHPFFKLLKNPLPALVPMHYTPWWFGMTYDGNEVDEDGVPTGAMWWWKVLQVTLRLMQQQISVRHRERPDRPQRREAKRLGFDAERDVVVVRLRREKGERHEPQGEANYSHRFIVSGHWRNQWYPSSQMHRQIWISPFVKGPEDAPLVVRPRRVYTWNR
jgi:hypothetical protein